MSEVWIKALTEVVDSKRVLTDIPDRYSYSFDASFGTFLPEAVIQVKSTEEVIAAVKIANQYQVPVYPRGQGTSLSGGPLPVQGGMVIDVALWKDTLEVYPDDLVAIVSPGVLTADINKAAEQYGLFYPPDPSSAHVSTIAGNLAENSGGPRGLKYGVTKDYVIGLEVVTPEGALIHTGGRTIKNVTGYDLTKLIVGSEGTLGMITKATLKLLPKPLATKTMMAVFDDIVDAGRAISTTLTSGILPSKMELMDQHCAICVENFQPFGLPTDAEAIILVELDGHPDVLEKEMQHMDEIVKEGRARYTMIAADDEEAARLWEARKMVSPAIAKVKPTKVSEDATVPRSKIPDMMKRLNEIRQKYHIDLVVFGHAGDGNLHPNIMCDQRDRDEMIRVEKAVGEIFQAAIALGGTLSGEHGIGTLKAPFMKDEVGATGLDMLKRVKESWDPNNIMNPGKIFPEPGQKLVLRDE